MSFDVDRYSSAWGHIALCADLTWTAEPPDEYVIANQRLWAQHCRVSQVLQETTAEAQSTQTSNQCEISDQRTTTCQAQENGGTSGNRSVKDVIPESRLAQHYGNFYYDEVREKCYISPNERTNGRGYNGQGCENSDLTECWMLPEVEYWFRKLVDESSERGLSRHRRQYRIMTDDDFERWDPAGARAAGEEAALAAKVMSVRPLWSTPRQSRPRAPSPPPAPRKIRARRRQPRRLSLAPPPPAYCLEVPAQLFCDPTCKFQFDTPRPPPLTECQRAMGRLSASVQAAMRAATARCPPYRGTNVSRYAPTGQRPARYPDRRYGIWWPKDHPSPRLDHRFQLTNVNQSQQVQKPTQQVQKPTKTESEEKTEEKTEIKIEESTTQAEEIKPEQTAENTETSKTPEQHQTAADDQMPSTSAAANDTNLRTKRLYSTVLSTAPINLTSVGCVRLSQKLVTPGLLKRNPKIILPSARIRPAIVDNKFEELEKEALEQYKASDESIDTKFHELEKEAVEQYSTSNSNTSCSSDNSAEKGTSTQDDAKNKKQSPKFHKEKAVDSVVIYSQNFPDLNAKGHASSVMNLKNFHTPPRGEKKEQTHRPSKLRNVKNECQRAASDTDYEARDAKNHKPMRWTLHVVPPKKRHLTSCVSDFSSDEEIEDATGSIKDATPRIHGGGKVKMSAHGGGDLCPILRKT